MGLSGGKLTWNGQVWVTCRSRELQGTCRISLILFKWVGLTHKRSVCYIGDFC